MATFKHISSKNADYGAAEQYLTFEHDEFTMKPTLDENGRLMLREDYRIATLNCGDEDFAVACMRSNLRYGKNQKREDVKSHHYIISFDPRDAVDNGLTVDRAQALGEEFCRKQFPGHQAIVCTHPDGHNHSGNIHVHSLKEKCTGAVAVCTSVKREKKTEQPPKLYDLTTLQREANRLFGFTAKQTLDYAQQLYEKKLLTYPRTDSQYLTEDMGQTVQHLVSDLLGLLPFAQGLDLTPKVDRVLNSKKVSDHHAILPTAEFVKQRFTGLAESECKLMNLVCSKLLCAVAAPHEYETVTAVFSCAGNEFTAKGKTVLVPGWKEIDQRFRSTMKADGEEETEALNTLPELAEGQSFRVTSTVSEHFTSPPKAYTEDTLLSAMERAGAEDMPEEAERKGLGTPATRAAILEKLVQMGFVQRKGKQLVPTKDGINLAVVLPESLTSPVLTAEWENRLTEIAKGNADADEFMAEIEAQVRQLVKTYSCISADKQNLFQSERVIIGKCPRCSENVYEGKKNFYCGNRSCQFVMWKNDHFFEQRKKAFTPKIAAALLKNGKAKVKGLYSEKTGKIYDATVLLADTGGKYVNYRVERKE